MCNLGRVRQVIQLRAGLLSWVQGREQRCGGWGFLCFLFCKRVWVRCRA